MPPVPPNPAIQHVLQFFKVEHQPVLHPDSVIDKNLMDQFTALADSIAARTSNQETTIALRKLLESRDAFVRSTQIG